MINRLLKLSRFLKNNNLSEENDVKVLIRLADMSATISNLKEIATGIEEISRSKVLDLSSFDSLKSLISDAVKDDFLKGDDALEGSIQELRDLMSKEDVSSFDEVSSFASFEDLQNLGREIRDSLYRRETIIEEVPRSEIPRPDSPQEKAPLTSYRPSAEKVSAGALFADLMAGVGNKNLCIAMVANAVGESALYPNINGDCGDYAKNRGIDTSKYPDVFKRPHKGRCCSFGLWQYNICGGLGVRLLRAYGASKGSSDQEKYEIITDYKKQVDFMIKHVRRKFDVREEKSIDEWVKLFVYKVERPADKAGATARRQEIARGLALA